MPNKNNELLKYQGNDNVSDEKLVKTEDGS